MHEQYSVVLSKVDESFNIQDTQHYGLAVQFSDASFVYSILDMRHNKYIVLHHVKRNESPQNTATAAPKATYGDFLKSLCNAMPWLKNPYKAVRVAYEGSKATLIPAPLFDPGQAQKYLEFNYRVNPGDQVFADHLVQIDTQNVYPVPAGMADAVKSHFPGSRVVHLSSVLIDSIWVNYKNRINAARVFLHLREKSFDLMIFDGRQMTYFNSFPHQNAEDVVYYLIFVLEQLNLNPENVHTVLLGQVERTSVLFELLVKYIRHVEFGRRNDAFKYSYLLNQVSPQAYYPLLNFFACGL